MNLTKKYWPELDYKRWVDCCKTLHRWAQIVGKVRLVKSPWINHSWQTTLYLTARGVTTSLIHDGARAFSIEFDFVRHRLEILESDGRSAGFAFSAESVASFYERFQLCLEELGIEARIVETPNELPDETPFPEDQAHRSYDPEFSHAFWQAMLRTETVMQVFRSKFLGKVSPVHFFWGALDLAVTRFSGRRAPEHPAGIPHIPDLVVREAYSHEVSSCGFWPGNDLLPYPAFYSYAYPEPEGFKTAQVRPEQAFYHEKFREFVLPYSTVRSSANPEQTLFDFFESTYEAAADLGKWDRKLLEESSYLEILQARHGVPWARTRLQRRAA